MSARALPVWVLAALLAAFGALACGFGPQDSFTGKRASDGVAPWEDLGAIQLCLANRRVGPPEAPVGGFCASQNAPADPPCRDHGDCGSRERCVCGRCTIQFCSSSEECGVGRVCSFADHRCDVPCVTNEDCGGEGEACLGNVCRRRCSTDDQCQTGEVCNSQGRCIVASCQGDDDCLAGELCRIQREPRATTEPSVLVREDTDPPTVPAYTMYLEMSNDTQTRRDVWRAVSSDGVSFKLDPATPVVGGATEAHAPSVLRTDGRYRLYYETATGISVVDSEDGVTFGDAEEVFAGDFHAPSALVAPNGEIWIFTHAGDREGIALSRGAGAPTVVLRPSQVTHPTLWRDVERLGSPFARVETSAAGQPLLRLWFDAFGKESADSEQFGEVVPLPPNDSIGVASTPFEDGAAGGLVAWPYNPVLDRTVAFLEHRAERSPSVTPAIDGQRFLLYFVGSKADGTASEGIQVARNPPAVGGD